MNLIVCTDSTTLGTEVLGSDGMPLSCGDGVSQRMVSADALFHELSMQHFTTTEAKRSFAALIEVPTYQNVLPAPEELGKAWMLGFSTVILMYFFAFSAGAVIRMLRK